MEITYTRLMQSACAILRAELSMQEYVTLEFIIQRTARFDKSSEKIPMRHFTHGVYTSTGDLIVAGVSTCKRTVLKALDGLQGKGYISIYHTRHGNRYTLLIDNIIAITCKVATMLKQSRQNKERKKRALGSSDTNGGVKRYQRLGSVDTSISKGLEEGDSKDGESSPKRVASSSDKVQEAQSKNRAARQKALERAGNRVTIKNVDHYWTQSVLRHYPETKTVPINASKLDYQKLKAGASAAPPPVPLAEFIDWVVENWHSVHGTDLSWVQGMPAIPSLHNLCVMWKFFVVAYSSGDVRRRIDKDKLTGATEAVRAERKADMSEGKVKDLEARLRGAQGQIEHLKRIAREKEDNRGRQRRKKTTIPDTLADEIGDWQGEE